MEHRFQHRHSEAFVEGRKRENAGARVPRGEFFGSHADRYAYGSSRRLITGEPELHTRSHRHHVLGQLHGQSDGACPQGRLDHQSDE